MFDQAYENLRKATESTLQFQQEMFRKWTGFWPGMTQAAPPMTEAVQKFQKKWAEFVTELLKKQRETLNKQYEAGLRNIEQSFEVAEVKTPEEFRAKVIELYQKSFEGLRQVTEMQQRDFQAAVQKWTELMSQAAVVSV